MKFFFFFLRNVKCFLFLHEGTAAFHVVKLKNAHVIAGVCLFAEIGFIYKKMLLLTNN